MPKPKKGTEQTDPTQEIPRDHVRVRAIQAICENVDGHDQKFAPGEEFILPRERAEVIASSLIEILK